MTAAKTTFALFYGNRGFFPASLIAEARAELPRVLTAMGHDCIALDPAATRHGAVETPVEGARFAAFLRENRGRFGGVILCLPNFGDETGAVAALREAGVPILVQAYPDTLDRMAPEVRRDAFCGKFSIMDVFCQYGVPFTSLVPHVAAPSGDAFRRNVEHFDRVCRVVNGVRGMTVGAIGARTTAFKTVRIDEVALQRHGITMETLDLSEVMRRMRLLKTTEAEFTAKAKTLEAYTAWDGVPRASFENIARLGVVLDRIVQEYRLDALALRCWVELQQELGISPCVLLGEMNDRGVASACEVDVGNAVVMRALALASGQPATCLDWNNNYADEPDKCILFHCGPVPSALMQEGGRITDHAILANSVGAGCGFGCNVGRIRPFEMTFGSMLTDRGRLEFYLGEGRFTSDPIPREFFGCAGVAEIPGLQRVLLDIGRAGHRHHVSVTPGRIAAPVREALAHYLGCGVMLPQETDARPCAPGGGV
jgi:L-fucose isomerase-like protein